MEEPLLLWLSLSLSLSPSSLPFLNPNLRLPTPAKFSIKASSSRQPLPTEKRSFAIAMGELFLGLALLLIRFRRKEPEILVNGNGGEVVGLKERDGESVWRLVEDLDEEVVWEQREKDVEAEREMKKVTSPGLASLWQGCCFHIILGCSVPA